MKDYMSLKILDKFKKIFEKFGVDYDVMRKILQIELTLDNRRVSTAFNSKKNNDEKNNNFSLTLLFYSIIGLFCMIIMFSNLPVFLKTSSVLGIIIFMVTTTFISDFSSVLLDVKYKNILVSKPINIKTINVSKILHIFIYIFLITMSFSLPSIIVSTIKYGILFGFVFFLDTILIDLMCILFTSLLYFLILYFFDGEKLKDIINYFQIFLSALLAIGYQLLARIFNLVDINVEFTLKWQHGFLPSTWFASLLSLIGEHNFDTLNIIFAVLSIVIPIVSIFIYFKFILPYFENNLQKLNSNHSKKSHKLNKIFNKKIRKAQLFCSNRIERSSFLFTQNMCSNERDFKLKVYPNLALSILLPFIMAFAFIDDINSFSEFSNQLGKGTAFLSLYILLMLLPLNSVVISHSNKYKGAWIYKVLPLKNPDYLIKGAFKGFNTKYTYPLFIFDSIVFWILSKFNLRLLFNIIIMFLILNLLNIIVFRMLKKELPFSKQFETGNSDNIGVNLLIIFLAIALGGIHFGLTRVQHGLIIYSIVLVFLNIFLWNKKLNITWDDIC